jgi:DNA-directed RNA polymerase subunit RPC12/RpoP
MAESPVITCPECRKKFRGKGNLEGKKIKCPFCAKPFVVPAGKKAEAAGLAPAALPAAPPPPAVTFADDDEDNPNPYGVTELDLAPRCPHCAREMEDEKAFICLHCGYNTLTREVGQTEKLMSHTGQERFMHLLPGIASALVAFGFICGMTYFSVVLPEDVAKSSRSVRLLDHESLRMWFTIIALGLIWGCGTFAYKRLIVEPTPPKKKKD